MAAIQVTDFGGIAPLYHPRKLGDSMATIAVDCRFEGGSLHPRKSPRSIGNLVSSGIALHFQAKVATDFGYPGYWNVSFADSLGSVHALRSPVISEVHGRMYWTASGQTPRYPRYRVVTGNEHITPTVPAFRLGVPAPDVDADDFSVSTTSAAASVDIAGMSNTAPVRVTLSVDVPFEEGQKVRLAWPAAADPSAPVSNMRELDGKEFTVTNVSEADRTFDLLGSNATAYTAYDFAQATATRVYSESDKVSRSYVVTFVTTYGEEGPPCSPSAPDDFNYDSVIDIVASGDVPEGFDGSKSSIVSARVYRTATGEDSANFYFMAEVPFSANPADPSYILSSGEFRVTVQDDKIDAALGELLPSTDWPPPPADMVGLAQMPGGFMVGFVGNTIYFSEPYQPHAWPDAYRKTVKSQVVGLAVFGSTLVIATDGKPYIGHGSDPASITLQELDVFAPCVAPRSVVGVGIGVAFIARDGLMLVSSSGARNITEPMFSPAQWALAIATDMECAYYDRRLFCLTSNASRSSFAIEVEDGGRFNFSYISEKGRAFAHNPVTGNLEFLQAVGSSFVTRSEVETGSSYLQYQWRSKLFTTPRPTNFGAGQVFADAAVTMKLYATTPTSGGSPFEAVFMSSSSPAKTDPFRLPAGSLAREWQIELVGNTPVHSVIIGESMNDIRAL